MDLALHKPIHRIDYYLFYGLSFYYFAIRPEYNRGVMIVIRYFDNMVLREVGITESTFSAQVEKGLLI